MAEDFYVNNYDDHCALAGYKVLIIDDDIGLSASIKMFLEDHDCEVILCKEGKYGIEKFEEWDPDILIVDLNMPGIDGHSVISYIAKTFPETPIIVVSGTGVIKDVVRAMKLGAWEFVTKPIMEFEDLEMGILRSLERASLKKENAEYKANLEKLVFERTRQLSLTIKELEATQEKAIQASEVKSEFLTQISHEVRTPLNIIQNYISLLSTECSRNEFEDYLVTINKAGKRLTRTIEMIVEYSELIAGGYEPKRESFNVSKMINEITAKYRDISSIPIETYFNSSVIINSDKYAVNQILNNIIDNAVKFTEKGKITISTEFDSASGYKIVISDTGIGISEKYMSKIYSPFSQEEQGYTRSFDGNGIGLAMTQKYCELNDIEIEIKSKKNIGTDVKLEFSLKNI
jgi:two-component system, sensor histidine kinase